MSLLFSRKTKVKTIKENAKKESEKEEFATKSIVEGTIKHERRLSQTLKAPISTLLASFGTANTNSNDSSNNNNNNNEGNTTKPTMKKKDERKSATMLPPKPSGIFSSKYSEENLDLPGELRQKEPESSFSSQTMQRRFRESTVLSSPSELYEMLQEIGEGSYGKVYKARHKLTNLIVAVKVIPIDNDLEELNKEITALKKVKDSNYVISYHGSFQLDHYVWIVMDLCEAGSVCDVIEICKRNLLEAEIREITAATLLGLVHLHSQRLIHRDVKAGNVLLSNEGRAKLADFGVSALVSTLKDKRNTLIGTPYWMAPEVILENEYDSKCDVWSLGITLIEMAETAPPLHSIHPMRAIFQIPKREAPKFKHASQWSGEMNDFLSKCLVKDPAKRSTSSELLSHPFVAGAVSMLQENAGKSEIIKSLALECGPSIEAHYREKKNIMEREGAGGTLVQKTDGGDTLKLNKEKKRQQPVESTGTFEAFDTTSLEDLRAENDKDFMKYFVSPTNSKQSISGDELSANNNKTLYISSTLVVEGEFNHHQQQQQQQHDGELEVDSQQLRGDELVSNSN